MCGLYGFEETMDLLFFVVMDIFIFIFNFNFWVTYPLRVVLGINYFLCYLLNFLVCCWTHVLVVLFCSCFGCVILLLQDALCVGCVCMGC
ncbi:unnamed protein product [Camellia sinensis]